jgi:hypothetical protein
MRDVGRRLGFPIPSVSLHGPGGVLEPVDVVRGVAVVIFTVEAVVVAPVAWLVVVVCSHSAVCLS